MSGFRLTEGIPQLAFGSRPSGTGLRPVRQPARRHEAQIPRDERVG